MRHSLFLGFLAVLFSATLALAAPKFPALTGRVVDDAHVLSQTAQNQLERSLAAYENGGGGQVVVVTLPSLQGYAIEDFGYQLGRAWGIGQKGKDNGVLLIVAPKERKVRIEVGYGNEGKLTDAISSQIINTIILPAFKAGHMEQGIVDGANAILDVLGGKPLAVPEQSVDGGQLSNAEILLILIIVIGFCARYPMLAWLIFSNIASSGSYRGSSSSGGGWGSGGFSGGGGSFGGGGATG